MKKLALGSFVLLAAAACTPQEPPAMTAAEQAGFDAAIAGRTAQAPQTCVSQRLLGGNKSFGEGIILFEGTTNASVWVNRPPNGCPTLDQTKALRTRTSTDQLCRNDIVTVFDPTNRIEFGSCTLGDFVEYRR